MRPKRIAAPDRLVYLPLSAYEGLPGWFMFSASYCNAVVGLNHAIDDYAKHVAMNDPSPEVKERRLYHLREMIRVSVRECVEARRNMLDLLKMNPCFNAR